MRQALLARSVPEDLILAERLMAAEYAKLVQGQPAELRSCLPSAPPENFRGQRYFSTLEMAVWQREDEEATKQMMSDLPVHPQEGGAGPAEEQLRRTWIKR